MDLLHPGDFFLMVWSSERGKNAAHSLAHSAQSCWGGFSRFGFPDFGYRPISLIHRYGPLAPRWLFFLIVSSESEKCVETESAWQHCQKLSHVCLICKFVHHVMPIYIAKVGVNAVCNYSSNFGSVCSYWSNIGSEHQDPFHDGWVDQSSVGWVRSLSHTLHVVSTGNRTPDHLILGSTPHPLGHVPQTPNIQRNEQQNAVKPVLTPLKWP